MASDTAQDNTHIIVGITDRTDFKNNKIIQKIKLTKF